MIDSDQYTKLEETIKNTCPELKELTDGCEIIFKEATEPERSGKIIGINEELMHPCMVLFKTDKGNLKTTWCRTEEIKEIVGHPVQLQHVLKTLKKHNTIKTSWYCISDKSYLVKMWTYGGYYESKKQCEWNLTKDLKDQSDKVKQFLINEIVGEKNESNK